MFTNNLFLIKLTLNNAWQATFDATTEYLYHVTSWMTISQLLSFFSQNESSNFRNALYTKTAQIFSQVA